MAKSATTDRLPNNALTEKDILMNAQQLDALKNAQKANMTFSLPQSSSIVDDDEQTIQDVLAEINAETNRHQLSAAQQSPPIEESFQQQAQLQAQMQAQFQAAQLQAQLQAQAQAQAQAQIQAQMQKGTVPMQASMPMQVPAPMPVPMSYQEVPASNFSSRINQIIQTITSNVKVFIVLAIILIAIKTGIVNKYIVTYANRYVPIPYLDLIIEILVAYFLYLILMNVNM